MRANRAYGQGDEQPQISLKADWSQGVNTLLPDDRLPPLQFKHGLNISLRKGYPEIRPGVMRAKWLYSQVEKLGTNFQGWGLIQGVDPDPAARPPLANLVVVDNNLWICAPNSEPILLMADVTDKLQEVEIIDCFDFALILRGITQTPLRYRYESGHVPEELPAPRANRATLPPSTTGVYFANRIWLKVGKNEAIASDILEWDYDPVLARWQFDDGENDAIVRFWKVGEDRIAVFKERSLHVIEGASQLNLVETADTPIVQIRQYRVAAARGLSAKWAIDQRGQTLFYLSRDGVEAMLLSDAGITAMSDKPISLPEKKYWDTLRWLAVEGAQMAIADQYLLLSVPTRYREDEDIPSLTLGGTFTPDPDDTIDAGDLETVTIQFSLGWNVSTEVPPTLTNYIEMPFFQALLWYPSDIIGPKYLQFRGKVRLWESGTVELIGEATNNHTDARDYNVWVGDSPGDADGHNELVLSVPGDSAWHAVNWSYRPPSGEFVHIRYDGNNAGTPARVWSYDDGGWIFPISFRANGDGGSLLLGTVTRTGTTYSVSGSLAASSAFSTGFGIYTYELDSADWSTSSGTTHYVDNVPPGAGTSWGPYTRTIPDSESKGVRLLGELAGGTGGSYGYGARCDFGPVLRSDYDPVVQQGIDPEA